MEETIDLVIGAVVVLALSALFAGAVVFFMGGAFWPLFGVYVLIGAVAFMMGYAL